MTQAPTPGPLSKKSIESLVEGDKLLTRQGLFLTFQYADKHDFLFCTGFGGKHDLDAHYYDAYSFVGRPDADGWMPWSGGENPVGDAVVEVKFRDGSSDIQAGYEWHWNSEYAPIIAFRLTPTAPVENPDEPCAPENAIDWPTAPVEASGSERDISGETFMGFRVAAWRYRQGEETHKLPHHYAEHWSTPGASAWGIQRLFTEDQLQQALSTTPARAEAQDEEAAGEREALALDRLANAAEVVRRLLHKTKEVQGPSFREAGISFSTAIDHARAVLRQRDALLAHPSPTPAADADRVREAIADVISHENDWRTALTAMDAAEETPEDGSGKPGYWLHQIKVLDRIIAALQRSCDLELL